MNLLRDPWNVVFFLGWFVYLQVRGIYARRTRGIDHPVRRVDWLEKLLLLATISSFVLPPLYLFTPLLNFADYPLPPAARWAGLVLMMLGLWLFWRSHADLGENWSATLELRKEHQLVNWGVYRRVRHPMYTSIFLFSLAQGLLLPNWLAGWTSMVAFTVLYILRTPREEQMLCEHLGQQYQEYMQQTGRLVPRLLAARTNRMMKDEGRPKSE